MSELALLIPEQPLERPAESADQNASVETEFTLVEQEKTLEKADIDTLLQKASELSAINEVQRGLEMSIIGSGLQVMTDVYGADKLLEALQSHEVTTFQDVIEKLAPKNTDREALYGTIKAEPMDELADRFNQTLGGVADGNPVVSQMESFRRYEMFAVENKRVMEDVDGNRVSRGRDSGGFTDSAGLLLTGNFNDLLNNHPELAENFRETNDTLDMLKDIRDVYETEYAKFSADLEQAKATLGEKIANGEAGIAELRALSDDIYGEEIAKLEARLATASNDAARELLQGMLDRKASEVTAQREEFRVKMEAVRSEIITNLGAENLDRLSAVAPTQVRSTYDDKLKDAA